MELKLFDYHLPEELIADRPLEKRDASRLMVVNRDGGRVEHRAFKDLKEYLREGDLIILNNTKVIPARLIGQKATGGKVEALLAERLLNNGGKEVWRCLSKPSKSIKPGLVVSFGPDLEAEALSIDEDGFWSFEFRSKENFEDVLKRLGRMPLPPYIRREADSVDSHRYQTAFAEKPGAVAAPTAGLHFTLEFLEEIREKGVGVRYITLHTGPGTFLPVRVENIKEHKMLKESYQIDKDVFEEIRKAKKEKRRVIAVGTTATRALESAALKGLDGPELSGSTALFIYPGFEFKVVDALLTNFHLPCSTLIMLVSAFAGRENIMEAYRRAVEEKYRFFSYGDAMLII